MLVITFSSIPKVFTLDDEIVAADVVIRFATHFRLIRTISENSCILAITIAIYHKNRQLYPNKSRRHTIYIIGVYYCRLFEFITTDFSIGELL